MGQMQFAVFPPERLTPQMAEHACLVTADQSCSMVHARLESGRLVLARKIDNSAVLHLPWPLDERHCTVLGSGTLMEQVAPYHLPLELARGTVGQLRGQLDQWKAMGLSVPAEVEEQTRQAVRLLGRAAVGKAEPLHAAQLAEQAIHLALQTADLLAEAYVHQVVAARRRAPERLMPVLGGGLQAALPGSPAAEFVRGFNTAVVPLPWKRIEREHNRFDWSLCDEQIAWARRQGLRVCAGPLVCFDRASLPEWLLLWEGDFDNIVKFVSALVRTVVERYRGRVDIWHCAARIHSTDVLGLSEEERLRLSAHVVELVRQLDPRAAPFVSFDQPWGEYMCRRELDFAPLHLADALVRAGLELAAMGLEINLAYSPGGTLPRTIVQLSRLVDLWSVLGLPLLVLLTIPGAEGDDCGATRRTGIFPAGFDRRMQQRTLARWVPLLLAKPCVCGVVWNEPREAVAHEFPHSGLFDAQDQPKPAWQCWLEARETFDPTAGQSPQPDASAGKR